jgi:glucose-6-phosphate dehydrogenase assembly protein OpcA
MDQLVQQPNPIIMQHQINKAQQHMATPHATSSANSTTASHTVIAVTAAAAVPRAASVVWLLAAQ